MISPILLSFFDYLSVLALAFMSYGIMRQWHHVYKTKSVKDIELQEVFIRFIITYVLLVKILLVGDIYLIIGQFILATVMLIYFATIFKLKRQNKNGARS